MKKKITFPGPGVCKWAAAPLLHLNYDANVVASALPAAYNWIYMYSVKIDKKSNNVLKEQNNKQIYPLVIFSNHLFAIKSEPDANRCQKGELWPDGPNSLYI